MIDPRHVGMLTHCLNTLVLNPRETALMRELVHAASTGTLSLWGGMNVNRAPEVWNLFENCKEQLNAQAA